MKIASSSIAMSASHAASSFTYQQSMTMKASASKDLAGAILTLSKEAEGNTLVEDMKLYQENEEEEKKQKQQENQQKAMKEFVAQMQQTNQTNAQNRIEISDSAKLQMELLRKLFNLIDNRQGEKDDATGIYDLRSSAYKGVGTTAWAGVGVSTSASTGTTASGSLWQKVTATSGFTTEMESTTFATVGNVQTADGRSIDFNVQVSMSRAFVSKFDTLETQEYILTDPLMINLDSDLASVTDQKFLFDLDADGKEESISFAGNGSGFLALDKNGDGKINDGSELFGTKSGDGFSDLAAYDEDGNGWIDENDSIFQKLKVWTKDEDGNDRLLDLKQADVGAIYLGSANTEYSLKNADNQTNGVIRKTGIYLKESSGMAGTISHVDLAI
jgi:hypothetical protein